MSSSKIILGISGGIAAYKTPELVRRLKDRGADVQVVMTRSAHEFVTATALQAVSGRPVRDNLWDKDAEAAMGHIELARWADLVLLAPTTAELMSRLAVGSAGDLLTTLCVATEAPVYLAPAMNHVMWSNPAVQENSATLARRGFRILGPGVGDQACGEHGPGRMLEPDELVDAMYGPSVVADAEPLALAGQTVMVTAGPTREAIDPVRFITNRSSGKMGYAIAEAARESGARVILVSGPVNIDKPDGVETEFVESASEMYAAVHRSIDDVDIFISAAAVSDYQPTSTQSSKIKKDAKNLSVELTRNPDILASVAAIAEGPFTVGFAAETNDLRTYALGKLANKKLDMIVANLVGENLGFDKDVNSVTVYWQDGEQSFPETDKKQLARQLIALTATRFLAEIHEATQTELPAIAVPDQ